ncbi:thioredoxin family protein [Neobacillus mesonae]|nr:thioredoxin family protein [Neobacillus mesonae]
MTQQFNLKNVVGKGIPPEQFMEHMKVREMPLNGFTNTKESFKEIYTDFAFSSEEYKLFFSDLGVRTKVTCFILCTDWCPDVIWNVPVLFRVLEHANIPTEVFLMEEHLEIMNHFLTNGGRAQPIAVFLDAEGSVLGRWGARPAYIQAIMDQFKQSHPDSQAEDYQTKLDQTYKIIGDLYRSGRTYQDIMIQELRTIFPQIEIESSDRNYQK